LAIRETASQTALVLLVANCTGCGRCATVCDTKLISMQPAAAAVETKPVILRLSERVACKRCGQPTVSRAELDFVIKQIGQPAWLELCPACRMSVPVKTGD
jgi:ferredoxin